MSEIRTRSRTLARKVYPMLMERTYAGQIYPVSWSPVVLEKTQTTTDEITSWPMVRQMLRDNPNSYSSQRIKGMDWGGDFSSETVSSHINATQTYDDKYGNVNVAGAYGSEYWFHGQVFPRLDTLGDLEGKNGARVSDFDRSSLIGVGATAISRTEPTNPVADSANFVGELLRDGIPSMIGKHLLMDRIHFFRSLGSEYLNVEFGWKPFLSDLQKFARVAQHSHLLLRQYRRDSGKLIRRRYRFPQIVSARTLYEPKLVQVEPLGYSTAYADSTGYGMQSGREYLTKDFWFSGAYTYYLSAGDSQHEKMERHAQEAAKLLGTRITPEVLWNLAPWSWAADWVANFGDVLRNLSALSADGLVMKYGYVMGKFDITHTHTTSGCTWRNGTSSGESSRILTNTVKLRQHATPFGFGLDPSVDFTARQYAILAALGLSHGNRIGW